MRRAALLASPLREIGEWRKGPIALGPDASLLNHSKGSTFPTGRAYECGAIVSRQFDPHDPPDDLSAWLTTAFRFYDDVLGLESNYIESAVPPVSEIEWKEQIHAGITGAKAERFVLTEWFQTVHPEWGAPVDKTNSTGLGYDFEFPNVGLFVEVKGFRGEIGDARLTQREWDRAKQKSEKFILCLVSDLDRKPKVQLIADPYKLLSNNAIRNMRTQITYSISKRHLTSAGPGGDQINTSD